MKEYNLVFTCVASTVVTVEAENLEEAMEAAYQEDMPWVCAHCSGWNQDVIGHSGVELSDVWELDAEAAYQDYPEGAA